MEQLNLNESLKPFFGGSEAASTFMASNYFHSDYANAVNQENRDSILGTSGEHIIFAKNYKRKDSMDDNDVHNQYADFIIRKGLFDKELDRSTLMGSSIAQFKKVYSDAVATALNEKVSSVIGNSKDTNMLKRTGIIANKFGIMKTESEALTFEKLGITNASDFYSFVIAHLFMLGKGVEAGDVGNAKELGENEVIIDINTTGSSNLGLAARNVVTGLFNTVSPIEINTPAKKETVREYVSRLVGRCQSDGSLGESSQNYRYAFCLTSFFDPAKSENSAAKALQAVINRGEPEENKRNLKMNAILKTMEEAFVNCALDLALDVFKSVGGLGALNDLFAHEDYADVEDVKSTFGRVLKNMQGERRAVFENCIADTAFSLVSKYLNSLAEAEKQYTKSIDNEYTKQIMEKVFSKWSHLDSRARSFYGKHLHLFVKRDNSSTGANDMGSTGWDDFMPDGEFKGMPIGRMTRLNLMKDRELGINVLFEKTLPLLPSIADGKKVWYTNSKKTLDWFQASPDAIRKLYHCAYMGEACVINGKNVDLPKSFANVENNNYNFDLDNLSVILEKIKSNQVHADIINPPVDPAKSFDALWTDLNGHIFKRDENGLYRQRGNDKLYVGKPAPNTCAGTQLGKAGNVDNDKCEGIVAKCLLGNDKEKLAKCLDELRETNLWRVAQDEMKNIDPIIALRILDAFGVPVTTGPGGKAESYDYWMNNIVSKQDSDVRAAILGNQNLLDYIKGVIHFVNTHPAICDTTIGDVSKYVEPPLPKIDQQLGKHWAFEMQNGSKHKRLFEVASLRQFVATSKPPSLAPILATPYTNAIPGLFTGVSAFAGPMGSVGLVGNIMAGGNNSAKHLEDLYQRRYDNGETAYDIMWGLYQALDKDLKSVGIKFDETSKEQLKDGLERIRNYQDKLIEIYVPMRNLAEVAAFFKTASCDENPQFDTTVSLKQIITKKQALAHLIDSINQLQDHASNILTAQNKSCDDILTQFANILEIAAKKQE